MCQITVPSGLFLPLVLEIWYNADPSGTAAILESFRAGEQPWHQSIMQTHFWDLACFFSRSHLRCSICSSPIPNPSETCLRLLQSHCFALTHVLRPSSEHPKGCLTGKVLAPKSHSRHSKRLSNERVPSAHQGLERHQAQLQSGPEVPPFRSPSVPRFSEFAITLKKCKRTPAPPLDFLLMQRSHHLDAFWFVGRAEYRG